MCFMSTSKSTPSSCKQSPRNFNLQPWSLQSLMSTFIFSTCNRNPLKPSCRIAHPNLPFPKPATTNKCPKHATKPLPKNQKSICFPPIRKVTTNSMEWVVSNMEKSIDDFLYHLVTPANPMPKFFFSYFSKKVQLHLHYPTCQLS